MSSDPARFRFGEFELDLEKRELRRAGAGRVGLQDKPFDLLVELARQAPAVVTREQLREALWGADTFVDVEHGLNTAVRKLRDALGDDAQAPRFVETVTRRGYRFKAPLEVVASEPTAAPVPVGPKGDEAVSGRPRRSGWWLAAALFGVLVAALGATRTLRHDAEPASKPDAIRSLAVLPLENLSGDPREDYFAAGMTDMLITQLAKIAGLQVVSRTTVLRYEDSAKTIPEIARELGVHAVVEGSVVRDGNLVRINAQLIDGESDRHLWAQDYESDLPDVVALQGRVARDVAAELSVRVSLDESRRLADDPQVSPPALEAYIRGRAAFEHWTPEATEQARGYFRRAIELDPRYADAHAAMAESYVFGADYFQPDPEAAAQARRFGEEALRLDPSSGSAHAALAQVSFVADWNWTAADAGFRRAIELSPNNAYIRHLYSHYLIGCGRLSDSLEHVNRMLQLEPQSAAAHNHLAYQHLKARQYDQAIAAAQEALRIQPNYVAALKFRYFAEVGKREYEQAMVTYREIWTLADGPVEDLDEAEQAFARGGWNGYLEWDVKTLASIYESDLAAGRPLNEALLWEIAGDYAGLDRKDDAFAWLEKSYAAHSSRMVELREDQLLDSLRDDPRYADLERRLGIPTSVESQRPGAPLQATVD